MYYHLIHKEKFSYQIVFLNIQFQFRTDFFKIKTLPYANFTSSRPQLQFPRYDRANRNFSSHPLYFRTRKKILPPAVGNYYTKAYVVK